MKLRLLLGCVVVLAVVATHSVALAAQDKSLLGDRFSVSTGYQMWFAKWQTPTFFANGLIDSPVSEYAVLSGPTITATMKIRKGNWFQSTFVNFTWLNGGFDFSPNAICCFTPADITVLRRDYTISAGLAIYKAFGVFAGYYNNVQRFTINGAQSTKKLTGPIVGVYGGVPVARRVALYGNVAMAFLDFKPLSGGTAAVQGYSSEIGANISGPRIWKVGSSLKVGYRAQIITETFGAQFANAVGSKANDTTWGPIFTVSAHF